MEKKPSRYEGYWILTAWSRVLLEKLSGSRLVKKVSALSGAQRFINTFTSACCLTYP